MRSPSPPRQLWDLDRSSRDFPNHLAHILLTEDCVSQAQDPQCANWEKLVEDLDYGLHVLDPTGQAFCRCLFELRRICVTHNVLPKSHGLLFTRLDVESDVIISRTAADMHEGLLDGVKVRVKKMRVYSQAEPSALKPFYHEAVIWKQTGHQNIVPFRGVTLDPYQLVFDWMENGDLNQFLVMRPNANRLGLLQDVAEGLHYLHSRNVVHGGIMGGCILVDHACRARISEFASATIHLNRDSVRTAGAPHTAPVQWTAPEVLEGKPLTKRADVFSFAMLMVEVFTGKIPFDASPTYSVSMKILRGDRPPRPTLLTDEVWKLMNGCWNKNQLSRPEMSTVLRDLTPSLLQSLYRFTKSSEFQVALNQFYDSTEKSTCVSRLRDAESRKFIDFLDDVLRVEGLSEDLRQRTLFILQKMCGEWAVLPDSCLVTRQLSKSNPGPRPGSRYAEVWKGRTGAGEGGSIMEVGIKVIQLEKIHKEFRGEIALWVKLDHPNILQCFGMTPNPLQIVTEWMPNGQVMEYLQNDQSTDRISLLVDIARGLEYLHSCGVIHGNLKQQNILLDSAHHARLSDIGFAKLVPDGGSEFDWAKVGAEGCRWAAPEIFQKGKLTKPSDVFTFGFIATEISLGKLLWEGMEVGTKILNGERPSRPGDEAGHNFTVELWRMFSTCWGKDPDSRITISEALRVLEYLPQQSHGTSYTLKETTSRGEDQSSQELIEELDKTLDTGMVPPKERPRALNRLCKKCETECSLPGSMVVTFSSLNTDRTKLPEAGGGFADVYQGQYNGCKAAVKLMRLYTSSNRELFLSRFCREAIVWRHLRHPNVLPLLATTLDLQDSNFALVSKWMNNGNINEYIKKHDDVNRAQLLVDVAHGLQYLHRFKFVHGDLKGDNILIKDDHRACLADFGFSTITSAAPHIPNDVTTGASRVSTDSKTSLMNYSPGGSKRWMSPELLSPEKFKLTDARPTKPSDCYALGMVIYEVLCGKPPFSDTKINIVQAITEGVRPSKPVDATTLGFTDGLWWTVKCCWLPDREMRPDVKTVLSRLTDAAWAWDMR